MDAIKIIKRLIKHLAARGFAVVGVSDGETYHKVTTAAAVVDVVSSVEESWLYVQKPGHKRRVIFLIPGNDEDVITDYSYSEKDADGFDAAMDAFPV